MEWEEAIADGAVRGGWGGPPETTPGAGTGKEGGAVVGSGPAGLGGGGATAQLIVPGTKS